MKSILIILAAVILTGCGNRIGNGHYTSKDFAVVCLDGVEYYVRERRGSYRGLMAVRYDSRTLQPTTCTGE